MQYRSGLMKSNIAVLKPTTTALPEFYQRAILVGP